MNILTLKNITYAPMDDHGNSTVILDDVSFELNKGEIVSLLGRSGSGKSTTLRIICDLIKPTKGEVKFANVAAQHDIAMVFQTFALFPWLTVSENIELALKARQIPASEVKDRTQRMIDIIGLNGCEFAFPRELSGGMRQRVGFARAMAVNPKILLLDEPFSALDIITAQSLRTDFLDLWNDDKVPIQSALLVTHSVEEAVLLSDRILIFSSNPGHVIAEIEVKLPHPRDRLDPKFVELVEEIYSIMTNCLNMAKGVNSTRYPRASSSSLLSFLEFIIAPPYNGTADLPGLSKALNLEVDDLFHIVDSLELMRFADTKDDIIKITAAGKLFATADGAIKTKVFSEHLIQYVPLASQIRRQIATASGQKLPSVRIIRALEKNLPKDQVHSVLKATISWGRFAGIFEYDQRKKLFYITK